MTPDAPADDPLSVSSDREAQTAPSHAQPRSQSQSQSEVPWPAIGIGAIFLAVVIGLAILLASGKPHSSATAPPAYASQISLSDLKVSQVQNFVGGTVTYLDGTVANNGDKTVSAASVEAVFKNSLAEVVQQEQQPLKVLRRSGPYPEALSLLMAPLAPHQHAEFRLIFEHISADWNQQLPALRITTLTAK